MCPCMIWYSRESQCPMECTKSNLLLFEPCNQKNDKRQIQPRQQRTKETLFLCSIIFFYKKSFNFFIEFFNGFNESCNEFSFLHLKFFIMIILWQNLDFQYFMNIFLMIQSWKLIWLLQMEKKQQMEMGMNLFFGFSLFYWLYNVLENIILLDWLMKMENVENFVQKFIVSLNVSGALYLNLNQRFAKYAYFLYHSSSTTCILSIKFEDLVSYRNWRFNTFNFFLASRKLWNRFANFN